ncbi:hypothetical protein BJ912DRAFT_1067880 [Pholiota molesta]|nr:hypothetical protein BJ912DRAFT_1067880 [Pholiota molesta]
MPEDEEQPKPVYFTPSKSAARVLEELVSKPDSLDNYSKTSFQTLTSTSNSDDTADASHTPRSHPRPLPPPPQSHVPLDPRSKTPPPPHASTTSSKDSPRRSLDSTSTSRQSKSTSKSLPRHPAKAHDDRRHRRHHSDPSTGTPPPDAQHHTNHRYARSHSRFTSDSITSIMAVTAERLARETARANEAERHATEVLSMFKTTHEAKAKLEREVQRAKDELGLYKVQLDVAQKEIFRAQEVVDKVERQRADLEEELLRTKDKMRKLARDLAVEHALEEGRRLGFEEGLRQGRALQPDPEPLDDVYVKVPTKKRDMRGDDDHASRITTHIYPSDSKSTRHESHPRRRSPKRHEDAQSVATSRPQEGSSDLTQSIYPQVSTYNPKPVRDSNVGSSSKYQSESTPDVARYAQPLPMPTITTPTPLRVPSTQPPIPPAIAPHSHTAPSDPHLHVANPPERIKVKPVKLSGGPIHPIPVHNGPSVAHDTFVLPPDGYIPIAGPGSVISLPAPHELSYPVAAEAPPRPPAAEEGPSRPRSGGRGEPPRLRVANPYPPTNRRPLPSTDSQSNHTYSTRTGRDTEKTEQEQRAPPPSHHTYTTRTGRDAETMEQEQRAPPPPMTPARSLYDRPTSTAPVRPPSGGPGRRTREVMLPTPMGDPFDDPTTANGNNLRPRSATPSGAPYGRPTLHTSFRSPEKRSSSTTPPDIQVETPSTRTIPSNRTTMVDPILLTPESANRPIALPDHHHHTDLPDNTALGIYSTGKGDEKIEMTLPDNNFPPGFVPLSPIPGMENLNPYPPGFAPTMPRNHPSGMADFVYSTPSVRTAAL